MRCSLPAWEGLYLHTCASVWYTVNNLLNYIQPVDYDFLESIQDLNFLQELCAVGFTPYGGTVGVSRGEFPRQLQRTPAAPSTLRLPPGPRGRRGHLPSSSVLSCSSIRVQSMREMTPFCRAGVGGQRWAGKPQPSRGGGGPLPCPRPPPRTPAHSPRSPAQGREVPRGSWCRCQRGERFEWKNAASDCWGVSFPCITDRLFVYKLFNMSFKLNFPKVCCCNYQLFATDCHFSN